MATADLLRRSDAAITQYRYLAVPMLRWGLGVTILLAGAHKLIAPAAWHAYLAPPIAELWPTAIIGLDPMFVLFGVSELLFGLLLLADWHTPTVAFLTGLSLLGVVVNLGIGLLWGEAVADVLIRDFGLAVFALTVAVGSDGGRISARGDR